MFGFSLPTSEIASFKALCNEAKAIIGDELGPLNPFSSAINMSAMRLLDGPSFSDVEEVSAMIAAAVRFINLKQAKPPVPLHAAARDPYVALRHLSDLKAVSGVKWDMSRLIELCRELNIVVDNECHLAAAYLQRAILDHVPPIFGFENFEQVASNHGGQSMKNAMKRLQTALRDAANLNIHLHIRRKENLPTFNQVNFRSEMDMLLSEVITKAA